MRPPLYMQVHSPCDTDESVLEAGRKAAAQHQQEMQQHQKLCAKAGDMNGARFFKEEAAHTKKLYRGYCYALGYITGRSDGDRKSTDYRDWPDEIRPFIERAFADMELAQ